MKTWFDHQQDRLEAQAAERAARKAQKEQENIEKQRRRYERFEPTHEKIQRLLDAMPPEERQVPRPLSFFQMRVRAKYPCRGDGFGSTGDIGKGLRKLGWRPRRDWSGRDTEAGIVTLWYPPTHDETKKAA